MNNNKIQSAIAGLLDMFRTGEIPEKIAIATNPKFDVPSSKWSLNNRLIQLFHGTCLGGVSLQNHHLRKNGKSKEFVQRRPSDHPYKVC